MRRFENMFENRDNGRLPAFWLCDIVDVLYDDRKDD